MAATNQTSNYGLPQWLGSDKLERTDMNTAMAEIDTNLNLVQLAVVPVDISNQFVFASGFSGNIYAHKIGNLVVASCVVNKTGGWTAGSFNPFISLPNPVVPVLSEGFIGSSGERGDPARIAIVDSILTIICNTTSNYSIRFNLVYVI